MAHKKLLALIGAALLMGSGTQSFAATTDGSEGTTSTGISEVEVTIPELVKISKISGFEGVNYTGAGGGVDLTDDICIYTNMDSGVGTNDYKVQIDGSYDAGSGATAGFKIASSATTQTVDFTVAWNDVSNSNVGESAVAASGNEVLLQTGWSNVLNCGGAGDIAANTTARLHIAATQANLMAVKAGVYTNTLTILITPTP